MAFTPEQARAELARRKGLNSTQIVPSSSTSTQQEQARAEIARRQQVTTKPAFNQPVSPVDRQNKIAQYNAEQVQYDAESKRANSVGGFLSNFGKALVNNIASSEVGLGDSFAKVAIANGRGGTTALRDTQTQAQDIQYNLAKKINEQKKAGADTTRLEKAYNSHIESMKPVSQMLNQRQADLPTASKVVGQAAGTALDVLTAGTYGKAAAGAKNFQLGSKVSPFTPTGIITNNFTPTSVQAVKNLATKPAGLITKQGVGNILKGAGVGYAYDVSRGLAGDRGADREGNAALLPGAGTAFGAAVPLAVALTKTFQTVGTKAGRESSTFNKRVDTLTALQTNNKKFESVIEEANKKLNSNLPEGLAPVDVKHFIAKSNVLNGAVDTNGTVNVRNALDNFDVMMRPYESQVRDSLVKEGTSLSVKDLQAILLEKSKDAGIPGASYRTLENEIKKELAGLAKFSDETGNIPLSALQDSKVFRYQHSNYMDKTANSVSKGVANLLKETIEDHAQSLDVKSYNEGLSQLYSIRNVLKALDKKKVEGGRMSKYFSSVIGGAAGSSFGPLGTIAGAEAGAAVKGIQMSRKFGSNIEQQLKIPGSITNQLGN